MAEKRKHKISEAGMRTLANFGKVPAADGHDLEDLTFVISARQIKVSPVL